MQFRDKYWFLSNMCPAKIMFTRNGATYQFSCLESAFQACKDPDRMAEFQNLNGFEAKTLGKQVNLRPDWEEKKQYFMAQLLDMKFRQNPELLQQLLATGTEELVEENTWGDTYWGKCNGQGKNMLGELLMNTRTQFQNELHIQPKDQTQAAQERKPEGKTLCFTGQRPGDLMPNHKREAYSMASYQEFKENLTLYLEQMYQAGYRNFISGGAQGFDQIAFWAVHDLKANHPDVQNILYLPFKGQHNRWLPNGDFGPEDYKRMMASADCIVWTNEHQGIPVRINDPAVPQAELNKSIGLALNRRNHAMVDDADIVIALYRDPNGINPTLKGSGTNNCMKYANDHGVPIYQIVYHNDPATGRIQPHANINFIPSDKARQPQMTPMWLQPDPGLINQNQTPLPAVSGREQSDLDQAYQNIQDTQNSIQENPTYDVDY